MLPPISTGWPMSRNVAGQARMARAEGARCALAVHIQAARLAVDRMPLLLAGVVRNVVDQGEMGPRHEVGEHLAGEVGDDLAVGQRAVDRRAHGAEIGLADRRVDGRAGELAVGQFDAVPRRGNHHPFEEFGADLMPQPARSAMNADHHLALAQAETVGRLAVVDLDDFLQFEVMVAGTEGADLVALAALGVLGHLARLGAGHAAMLLDAIQIGLAAVALLDRPARAAAQHRVHLAGVKAQLAGAAHPGRNVGEQAVGQTLLAAVRSLPP